VFAGGFGGFLGERIDNLLVSGTLGPAAMSFYSMAWNGSRTPANVFGSTIGFVLIPTLSRIQDEPARIQRAIRESLRHSYLLLAPACAVLFVCAPLLVVYVLGTKWLPLVPCLRVMSVTVLAIPILHACNALLIGSGRAHLTGISTTVHLFVLAVLIPTLARSWYILGAAFADLAATGIMALILSVTAWFATRRFTWSTMSAIVLPVAAAFFAALVSWSAAGQIGRDFVRLVAQVAILLLSYPFFIVVLGGRGAVADLVALLRGALRRMNVVAESGV
jgi:PST family polysaccharide transporter